MKMIQLQVLTFAVLLHTTLQFSLIPNSHVKLSKSALLESSTNTENETTSKNPSETQVYVPRSSPKVYTPKSATRQYPAKGNSYRSPNTTPDRSSRPSNSVPLTKPLLLVKYRVPRVKSEFKSQLEELQSMYSAADAPAARSSYKEKDDSFLSKFDPAPTFSEDRPSSKGKKKDYEKKSEEGRKSKASRRSSGVDDDDDDDYDYQYERESSAGDFGDYYGEEVSKGISSIGSRVLLEMETEGFSLEDMQVALYGEYGVKAGIPAIRRKLNDDKFSFKGRKRTGKTRKDRQKARFNSRNPEVEDKISLPFDDGFIQVSELAGLLDLGAGEILKHLMMNEGVMVTINQNIDLDTAKRVVYAFGREVEGDDETDDDDDDDDDNRLSAEIEMEKLENSGLKLVPRPPVVTIMGHVDHGKTSLLDRIRSSKVAAGEAGGITQGISAFKVKMSDDKIITFIDTPGHAAFSDMRKRGANLTDIVVLVVAADDGVMDQTKECIAAAKVANCPIVLAVNKIDKEGAEPDKVKTDLMSQGVITEDFGGDVQSALISAKQGTGIDELLDKILLQSEILNLRTPEPDQVKVEGVILEARMDRGLGVVATAMVQQGSLKVGDLLLAGPAWGRVRRLLNDQGKEIGEATASTPVQIVGLSAVPEAGDTFVLAESESAAKEVATSRQRLSKMAISSASNAVILANAVGLTDGQIDTREQLKVPVVIKGDVSGSVDALKSALAALEESDDSAICLIDVVYAGVGEVTSSDVGIAAAAKAKIIAFNVPAGYNAMEEARASNIEISHYNVVYELLEELKEKVTTTLAPPPPGILIGSAKVKKTFKIGRAGKVAGCEVLSGSIKFDSKIRIMRGKRNPIHSGVISSLKVVKDDVVEVPSGSECGISVKDFTDYEEGDVIECFVSKSQSENN